VAEKSGIFTIKDKSAKRLFAESMIVNY